VAEGETKGHVYTLGNIELLSMARHKSDVLKQQQPTTTKPPPTTTNHHQPTTTTTNNVTRPCAVHWVASVAHTERDVCFYRNKV